MKSLLRRLLPAPPALSPEDAAGLLADLPWLSRLDVARRERLFALTARFLARKAITPVHGLALSPVHRRRLAALACLPLLEFGEEGLRGWSEVIVYPGAFRVHRRHHDEDTGVVAEWEDELAGEAWDQALSRPSRALPLPAMRKAEALALSSDGLRLFVGMRSASASTSDLSSAAIDTLVERVLAMAARAITFPLHHQPAME